MEYWLCSYTTLLVLERTRQTDWPLLQGLLDRGALGHALGCLGQTLLQCRKALFCLPPVVLPHSSQCTCTRNASSSQTPTKRWQRELTLSMLSVQASLLGLLQLLLTGCHFQTTCFHCSQEILLSTHPLKATLFASTQVTSINCSICNLCTIIMVCTCTHPPTHPTHVNTYQMEFRP